jgi:hypothetical protein
MDDAVGVSVLQGGGDLLADAGDLGRRQRPGLQSVGESFALDVLHGNEMDPAGLTYLVDMRHVGVAHCRCRLRLQHESAQPIAVDGEFPG